MNLRQPAMSGGVSQEEIDRKNSDFWNELCGSQLARQLGITDDSPVSLKLFDDWYFHFYPYLESHIPTKEMVGKNVLEVGLGYGSVAQKLAQSCHRYCGLDIATGPVAMAQHRCNLLGITNADVRQGSILEPPFIDESFDWVVSIGCLHHTGNLAKAINVVRRLLKPRGQAIIMVYSAASYRQFITAPGSTIHRLLARRILSYQSPSSSEHERGSYDTNLEGDAAPQTEFVTKAELAHLCRDFARVTITAENIGSEGAFRFVSRRKLCKLLGPIFGLDLYCHVHKTT